jgi:hypothetical protein
MFCPLRADVAQLVEQRFRKPQVTGSNPVVGSSFRNDRFVRIRPFRLDYCSYFERRGKLSRHWLRKLLRAHDDVHTGPVALGVMTGEAVFSGGKDVLSGGE